MDENRDPNTGHLLAALHPPFAFVLWDTSDGSQVWRKTYTETLQGFDFDPFDSSRMAFRCLECILFVEDFNTKKVPGANGKKFYVLGPTRGSPNKEFGSGEGEGQTDKGKVARAKIKRIMKDLVMGEALSLSGGQEESLTLSECIQVLYHRAVRNHLLLIYPREVLILDLDIGQTVGIIALDRNSPSIISAFSAKQRDVIYLINESGTISMRQRKRLYHVAATPVEPIRNMSKSASTYSVTTLGGDTGSVDSVNVENVLEIAYEQKAFSEGVRLNKNAQVLGMACHTMTEKNFVSFTSDGRILFYEVTAENNNNAMGNKSSEGRPVLCLADLIPSALQSDVIGNSSISLKLFTSGILSGLTMPPFVIRMCPPLTMKNMSEYRPCMAIGAGNGNIQIANMSTGMIEREFAVHTFPVRGIEWASLHAVLSHAHQNLSGSVAAASDLVRNELIFTDVGTGKTISLRSHRSEEPPIDMLRVSHLKQYFIVAFVGAPFELWDLRSLSLLRTMPKKFPPITALDWSPLHNLKSLKKKLQSEAEKKKGRNSICHVMYLNR